MQIEVPLITPLAMKYYNNASCKEQMDYYRALDIRLCLEKLCDELIFEFVSSEHKDKWNGYNLHNKLIAAKSFIDNIIIDNLLKAKRIGNTGAHYGEEGNIVDSDIENAKKYILEFSLNVFVSYFKKYGFDAQGITWIPTVFSTLPPSYRVLILKEYYATNPTAFVINKLSLAYLKDSRAEEARLFLKKCFDIGEIDKGMYVCLNDNLSLLEDAFKIDIKRFSIASNLDEARDNFMRLLPSIKEEDRNSFVILISMLLNCCT